MKLDPRSTALVMIDLQKGVLGRPPLPNPAREVLESATELAGRFRHGGAAIVWVRAWWSPDFGDALRQSVDKPPELPSGGFPADFASIPEGLVEPSDFIITMHNFSMQYILPRIAVISSSAAISFKED
jgi:nicotinamidase-related amidase